ncbi:hypothetical protein EPO15_05365 [bacterium]|nr:MAG: hypothetical protein EPO15_05365 [bacterium]
MPSALIDAFVLAFAGWTVLCHATVLLDASLVALLWAALPAAVAGVFLLRRLPRPEGSGERALLGLCLLCAAAVLVAHRPDSDDGLYLGFAGGVADFPRAPLLKADALHGIPGLPILLSTYRFHSIEALYGAVSYLTGLSVLAVSHLGFATLFGFLAPLAWARLFRVLTPGRWLWGVAGAVGYLLLDGGAHAGWGNLAFVRLFQGKAAFLTVLSPLVVAYALAFGAAPTPGNWLRLAAGLVASAGLTASALWAAPLTAAAALATAWRPNRDGLRAAAGGAAAAAYPLAVALVLRAGLKEGVMGQMSLPPGLEGKFLAETLNYVVAQGVHRWALALLLAAAPYFAPAGAPRRWAAAASGLFLLLFNPWTGPWVALNLTSPWNYNRLFWLLPVPAAAGLAAAAEGSRSRRLFAAAVLAAALVPPTYVFGKANGVRLGFPSLKVPAEFPLVRAVNAGVPGRGIVLAPTEVSNWLVTERGHAYPLLAKEIYFDELHRFLPAADIARRRALMDHVGGERPVRLESPAFRAGLRDYGVAGVVLYAAVPWAAETRGDLAAAGYSLKLELYGYELWVGVSVSELSEVRRPLPLRR